MTSPKVQPNQRFGSLVAKRKVGPPPAKWRCLCDCGQFANVLQSNLLRGNSTTCGCGQIAATRASNTRHGGNPRSGRTREYRIWLHMKQRCHYPASPSYKNYGKRGITVCDEWRESFGAFIRDMGKCPGPRLSIERLDNDKGYSPDNCVWASYKVQGRNKRNTFRVTIDGVTKPVTTWGEESGIKTMTIRARLERGWSAKDAVFTPLASKKSHPFTA